MTAEAVHRNDKNRHERNKEYRFPYKISLHVYILHLHDNFRQNFHRYIIISSLNNIFNIIFKYWHKAYNFTDNMNFFVYFIFSDEI